MHRTILGLDIEGSTSVTNVERSQLLQEALRLSGIRNDHIDPFIDRGDGLLALVRPVTQASKSRLLDTVIPTLRLLLTNHNHTHPGRRRLRMRAVLHAGEVHFDDRSGFGEALDLSCRLLDSPELRRQLRDTDAPMVLVVSEDIHRSVVRQGYNGINPNEFDPAVRVHLASTRCTGWVTVPKTACRTPVCGYDQHQQEPQLWSA